MNTVCLPDNHRIFSTSSEISDMFSDIKSKLNLCSFVYIRIYLDSSCFILTDYAEMINHHLKSGYTVPAPVYLSKETEQIYNYIPLGIDNSFSQARYDHTNIFRIGESLDVIRNYPNYTEIFTVNVPLDSTYNPSIVYLNNQEHFNNFIKEFRYNADKIITEMENHKFILPSSMQGVVSNRHNKKITKRSNSKSLPEITDITTGSITNREMDALFHLTRGKSTKVIAKDMGGISPRTVEDYINSLKSKLNCSTKSELISKIWKTTLPYKRYFLP